MTSKMNSNISYSQYSWFEDKNWGELNIFYSTKKKWLFLICFSTFFKGCFQIQSRFVSATSLLVSLLVVDQAVELAVKDRVVAMSQHLGAILTPAEDTKRTLKTSEVQLSIFTKRNTLFPWNLWTIESYRLNSVCFYVRLTKFPWKHSVGASCLSTTEFSPS